MDIAKARLRINQLLTKADKAFEKARSLPMVIRVKYTKPKVQILSVIDNAMNPVPERIAPIKNMYLGPNLSTHQPAKGPIGPPSDLESANTNDMVARLTPRYSITGSINTTNP